MNWLKFLFRVDKYNLGSAEDFDGSSPSLLLLICRWCLTPFIFIVGSWANIATAEEYDTPSFADGSIVASDGTSSPRTTIDAQLHGYFRQYIGWNLEDHPEPDGKGGQIGGAGDISIMRSVVKLDGDINFGKVKLKAVGRVSSEYKTSYLRRLENAAIAQGGRAFVNDQYNEAEIREFYAAFPLTERIKVQLGKQQMPWGEADFFHATDVVQGYDTRWRSTLERENEETRNPTWLANIEIAFPEVDGNLQLIYGPGWGSGRKVVNNIDLAGGRFAGAGYHGVDSTLFTPYNYHQSSGDTSDDTWGFRWSGNAPGRAISYSLLYYHGLNYDPIVNSVATDFPSFKSAKAYGQVPANNFGEIIYPRMDTYGVTFNADLPSIDTVLRGELAYQPKHQYNIGSSFCALVGPPPACAVVPGIGGILEKSTVRMMLGFDNTAKWTQSVFGTARPGLWTLEVFDRWITGFKDSDDIVELFGYSAKAREHQTFLTSTLTLNYLNDRLKPSLALLWDTHYGDTIWVGGLDYAIGDKWRIYSEISLNFPRGPTKKSANDITDRTHLLSTGADNSQLLIRATYQF